MPRQICSTCLEKGRSSTEIIVTCERCRSSSTSNNRMCCDFSGGGRVNKYNIRTCESC